MIPTSNLTSTSSTFSEFSLKLWLIFLFTVIVTGLVSYFVFNSYIQAILITFMVNAIMALSLNFITGVADQFSLGQAGLMAIGAYTSAVITKEFLDNQWFFAPITILLGGVTAGLVGYLVSIPSFRLKGDYLAIVTLGMAEIIRVIFQSWNYVGGPRGYNAIAKFPNFLISFTLATTLLTVTFLVLLRLKHTWLGRNLWAINEDDVAAEVMGVNLARNKRWAFIISSFFAGLGGGFYAHHMGYISPKSFGFLISVQILITAVLGGLGSMSGSVIAALILTATPELLRSLPTGNIDIRMIVFPILLILVMILRPQGIFGRHEVFEFLKNRALSRKRKAQ